MTITEISLCNEECNEVVTQRAKVEEEETAARSQRHPGRRDSLSWRDRSCERVFLNRFGGCRRFHRLEARPSETEP